MKSFAQVLFFSMIVAAFFACTGSTADSAEVGDATDVADASANAASFTADLGASLVNWKGFKPGGEHSGILKLSEGSFAVKAGKLEAGSFTLDMTSIENLDLEAGKGKEDLTTHLKSADFFNTEAFPTAKFEIAEVSRLEGDSLFTHTLKGNLTMKDSTKSVAFRINSTSSENGVTAASETFKIDRTQWGIVFKSPTALGLKDKFINDEIELQIKLVANKDEASTEGEAESDGE